MENEVLKQRAQEDNFNQSWNEQESCFWQWLHDDHALDHLIQLGIPPFIVTLNDQNIKEQHYSEVEQDVGCNPITQSILTYSRKEKSLSQLTKKFIDKFEGASCTVLALDQVTQEMNVERRRIYDIINIMESLRVVSKIRKNIYQWKGLKEAIKTIQAYSRGENLQDYDGHSKGKKQRSLQSLATQFLKVFSISRSVITLEEASIHVLNESIDEPRKTKVRRLYDIVNVFKCMGLVKKVKQHGQKPGYEWLGCRNLQKIIEEKNKGREFLSSEEGEQMINDQNSQFQTKIYDQFGQKIKNQQSQKQDMSIQKMQVKQEQEKQQKFKNYLNNQQLSTCYRDKKQTLSINSNITSPRTYTKQKSSTLQNQSFRLLQFQGHSYPQTKIHRTNSHHHIQEEAKIQEDQQLTNQLKNLKYKKRIQKGDRILYKQQNQGYFLQILRKLGINKYAPVDQIRKKISMTLWNFEDQKEFQKQNFCYRGNHQFN